MPHDGNHLLQNLDIPADAAGVFGVCCTVLTWSGVAKGLDLFSPWSWMKSMGKLLEDGHETTFLYDKADSSITLTGISDDGWVFDKDSLGDTEWARDTINATT